MSADNVIQLTVILVNHNAKNLTLDCIQSIYDKTDKISFEIILVDNNSTDGSIKAVKEKYPEVILIENKTNRGFGAANNQAIRVSKGKYIILLNNDTELKNDALSTMVKFMDKNSGIGALTCKLYEGGKSNIQHNCRAFPTPIDTIFGRASLLTKLFPNNPISKRNLLADWDYNSARRVDWVSGAAMMVRREVVEKVGLLDEKFFMYWEDTDWCRRIYAAGWEIWYIPEGEIIHYTGKGGGERPLKLRLYTMSQMHRSAYYYFLKHYYKNSLHPIAILTFVGMLLLIFFKTINEIFAAAFFAGRAKSGIPSLWIINQCFHPDIDATAQIMTDLAEDLVDKGMQVTVITGRNNNSYNKREVYNGINIIRVGVLKLNKKVLFFRYLNYISLFPSILIKSFFLRNPDYILVVSSPPFVFFLGSLLKTLRRSKLILNVQDLYPDVAVKLKLLKNPAFIKALEYFSKRLYRRADKIICISEIMQKKLIQKECPGEKIEVVHNWADKKLLHPIAKEGNSFILKHKLFGKFVLQYAGNFGMVQEMDTILETADYLKDIQNIVFVLVGDGVQSNKIRSFILENKLNNILLIPYQRRELINFSLNACDLSFVTLKKNFQGTVVPSKVYSTMATGKPVLAICPEGSEIEEMVNENRCGVVLRPGDFKGCAEKILYLYHNPQEREIMGKNALKAFLREYERSIATDRYFEIISKI